LEELFLNLQNTDKLLLLNYKLTGRTNDRNTDLTFEQDANDVAKLLKPLKLLKQTFWVLATVDTQQWKLLTATPNVVNKIILCSAFYKRSAVVSQFWEGFDGKVKFSNMPQAYKEAFLKINNNSISQDRSGCPTPPTVLVIIQLIIFVQVLKQIRLNYDNVFETPNKNG
jgi:hypothetical protein